MFSRTITRSYFSSKNFGTVKAATPIYFLLTYRLINDVTNAGLLFNNVELEAC